jgi:TPR repeat protein
MGDETPTPKPTEARAPTPTSEPLTMFQKIVTGIVGVIAISGYIAWHTAVAVHDRTRRAADSGNVATAADILLNLQANSLKDTAIQAQTAYDKGDYATARKLYLKIADHGDSAARLHLGVMYSTGKGGPADPIEAVKWFRLLADDGNREGQYALGLAYENGTGVAQDYWEAMKWYQKSAAQGSPAARVNLGTLYVDGHGTEKDLVEAQKWFILAGELGQKNRGSLDALLTPEQKAEAKQRADEWRVKK